MIGDWHVDFYVAHMLDLKFIRENIGTVRRAIREKGVSVDLDAFLRLDEERKNLSAQADELKYRRNEVSGEIGRLKRRGEDASSLIAEMRKVSWEIKGLNERIKDIEAQLKKMQLSIPNVPDPSVPLRAERIKSWGRIPEPMFDPLPHWELGERLGVLDLRRASKVAGPGFALFKGAGARLERALVSFMLDLHTQKHGYTEVLPPFLVNRNSMTGTGQLPRMEEDMYHCEADDLFLTPTAEVPVTNIHRDEILSGEDLPINYAAYTPCFRREAGTYGKKTRGLTRVHQFDKVELIKFVCPEDSADELEGLLCDVEEVLKLLGLPYRVVNLCAGDLSFASAFCYDIEVWAMGLGGYLKVSSCRNFRDFQARRANIRFRRRGKVEFVHTLNASGLALPRTVIAIMENYQREDGTIVVPEALEGYMGGLEKID